MVLLELLNFATSGEDRSWGYVDVYGVTRDRATSLSKDFWGWALSHPCIRLLYDNGKRSMFAFLPFNAIYRECAPGSLYPVPFVGVLKLVSAPALPGFSFQTPGLWQTACLHAYTVAWDPSSKVVSLAPRSSSNIYTLASTHPQLWGPRDTGTRIQWTLSLSGLNTPLGLCSPGSRKEGTTEVQLQTSWASHPGC